MNANIKTTTIILAGQTTVCQLGNPGDSSGYCEAAPVVVLACRSDFNGVSYIAVAKKADGTLLINPYAKAMRSPTPNKLYSTAAFVESDIGRRMSHGDAEYIGIHLGMYKKEIAALDTYVETKK